MEPLERVKRKDSFKEGAPKPTVINDSRFGIRRLFLNSQERPRIKTYSTPGRGQNGEHQS